MGPRVVSEGHLQGAEGAMVALVRTGWDEGARWIKAGGRDPVVELRKGWAESSQTSAGAFRMMWSCISS